MKKFLIRGVAFILFVAGSILVLTVVTPIVLYETTSSVNYETLLSPIVEAAAPDYTKASNWFIGAPNTEFKETGVSFYNISIPKLKIENATVAIGGEDLSKSLVQYPGTALPGKVGNAVIFGHSILPIYYDPTNYMAIFSTLPTLKKGDEISVNYDGVYYKYRVETLFEVLPTDIQVLEQNSYDSYLTLVTCVPPGHPLKPRRLVVRAKIVPPNIINPGHSSL